MILQKLKQALEGKDWVEQSALMREFNVSADALDSMLSIWMRRGQVIKNSTESCAGHCGCGDTSTVQYRWSQPGHIGLEHISLGQA